MKKGIIYVIAIIAMTVNSANAQTQLKELNLDSTSFHDWNHAFNFPDKTTIAFGKKGNLYLVKNYIQDADRKENVLKRKKKDSVPIWYTTYEKGSLTVSKDEKGYYHSDANNTPAYEERYLFVSGFSNGLAVAINHAGNWFHITPDGTPAYKNRYFAVHLFYEGYAIASNDGKNWFHITPDGVPAYQQRFSYVKEFSEGYAAVENTEGFFFINYNGEKVGNKNYSYAYNFKNGSTKVYTKDGKKRYIKAINL